jgi:hypothetical protein
MTRSALCVIALALGVPAVAGAGTSGVNATATASGQISFYASLSAQIDASLANTAVVRPSVLFLTYDGAVVVRSLRWSRWGGTVAHATGVYSASNCNPSCATGQRTNNSARVTLSSPGRILGHEVYRCYQLTVPTQGKNQRSCLKRQGTSYTYEVVSTPTSNAALKLVRFYTPSKNIHCEMSDNGSPQSSVFCDIEKPGAIASVFANGHVTINRAGSGNFGEGPPFRLLPYGSSATAGRFRCKSAVAGVTCVVIKTGRGFFISKQSVRTVG